MVYIIPNCDCNTCLGNQPVKPRPNGEMVFGGSICNCKCHTLKGKKRKEFITNMKALDELGDYLETHPISPRKAVTITKWKEGDILKSEFGYLVYVTKVGDKLVGSLICKIGHSCRNIPYSLDGKHTLIWRGK